MDFNDRLKQAEEHLENGNYEEAIQITKALREEDESHPEAKRVYEAALDKQWQEKKDKQEADGEIETKKRDMIDKAFDKDILRKAIQKVLGQDLSFGSTMQVNTQDVESEKSRLMGDLADDTRGSSPGNSAEEKVETWVEALKMAPEYEEVRRQIKDLQEKGADENTDQEELKKIEQKLNFTLQEVIENVDIVDLLEKLEEEKQRQASESDSGTSAGPAPEQGEVQVEEGPLNLEPQMFEIRPGAPKALRWVIHGAIDSPAISQLEKSVMGNSENGYEFQLLDFTGVKYINSTGMGTMVKLGDLIREKGGDLLLIEVQEKVKELFNMLGLLAVIQIVDSDEEARAKFMNLVGEGEPAPAGGDSGGDAPKVKIDIPSASTEEAPVAGGGAAGEKAGSAPDHQYASSRPLYETGVEGPLNMEAEHLDLNGQQSALQWNISGAIDTMASTQMEKTVLGAADDGELLQVLDFEGVKYINSTGMGTLVKLGDLSREKGGDLCLTSVSEKVRELFNMLGLLAAIHIVENDEVPGFFAPYLPAMGGAPAAAAGGDAPSSGGTGLAKSDEPFTLDLPQGPLGVEAENLTGNGIRGAKLNLSGPIDTVSVSQLEKSVGKCFESGYNVVVTDFAEVKYINSTGIGTLVKLSDTAPEGQFYLVNVSNKVNELFGMLGMLDHLKIYDDVESIDASDAPPIEGTPTAAAQPDGFGDVFDDSAGSSGGAAKGDGGMGDIFEDQPEDALSCEVSTERISVNEEREALAIQVEGKVGKDGVEKIAEKVSQGQSNGDLWQILDMEKVEFINSEAMSELVKLGDPLKQQGGELIIVNTSPQVQGLSDSMGLSAVANFQSSREDAVEAFKEVTIDPSERPMETDALPADFLESNQEMMDLVQEGNEMERDGDLEGAIGKWEKALEVAQDQDKAWISKQIDAAQDKLTKDSIASAGQEEEEDFTQVGQSEMNVERELIDLIEKGNQFEKSGEYEKAIEVWEDAMQKAHYKGGLQSKIDRLKEKLGQGDVAEEKEEEAPVDLPTDPMIKTDDGSLDDLDRQLEELSQEASEAIANTPVPGQESAEDGGLDDLFSTGGAAQPAAASAAAGGGDNPLAGLFDDGETATDTAFPETSVSPTDNDLGDLFDEETSSSATATADDDDLDDLFGGGGDDAPAPAATADSGGDDLDDLFGDEGGGDDAPAPAATADSGGDDLDDLFGDEGGGDDAPAPAATTDSGGDDLDDIFGDEGGGDDAPAAATAEADGDEGALDDIFGDEDPSDEGGGDEGQVGDFLDEITGGDEEAEARAAAEADSLLDEITGGDEGGFTELVTEEINMADIAKDTEVMELLNQADALEKEGNFEEAMAKLEQANSMKSTPAVTTRMDRVRAQLGGGAPAAAPAGGDDSLDIFGDSGGFGFDDPVASPSGVSDDPLSGIDFDNIGGGGEAGESTKSGKGKFIAIGVLVLLLAVGGFVMMQGMGQQTLLGEAQSLLEEKKYDEALAKFEEVGGPFAFLVNNADVEDGMREARFQKHYNDGMKKFEESKNLLTEQAKANVHSDFDKSLEYANEEQKAMVMGQKKKVDIYHLQYLAKESLKKQRYFDTVEKLREILKREKGNKFATQTLRKIQKEWMGRVNELLEENKWDDARTEARQIAKAFPKDESYANLVPSINRKEVKFSTTQAIDDGDWTGARDTIVTYLSENDRDTEIQNYYKDTRSDLEQKAKGYASRNQYGQAISYYENLLKFTREDMTKERKVIQERLKVLAYQKLLFEGDQILAQKNPDKLPVALEKYSLAKKLAPPKSKESTKAQEKIAETIQRGVAQLENWEKQKKYEIALALLSKLQNFALSEEQQTRFRDLSREYRFQSLVKKAKVAESKGEWQAARQYFKRAEAQASPTQKQQIERDLLLMEQRKRQIAQYNSLIKQAETYESTRLYDKALKKLDEAKKVAALYDNLIKKVEVIEKRISGKKFRKQLQKYRAKLAAAKRKLKTSDTELAYKLAKEAVSLVPKGRFKLRNQALDVLQKAQRVRGMAYVKAGPFWMGQPKNNDAAEPAETPKRRVLVRAYYIDKYEVTNEKYRKFLNATRRFGGNTFAHPMQSRFFPKGKNRTPRYWNNPRFNSPKQPVVGVDWFDAYAYAKWAGKRLPSEKEWEKAARGTNSRQWPWGNKWDKHKLNHWTSGIQKTTPVGSYVQGVSSYGCHDMAGNVWEWVANWFQPYPGCTFSHPKFGQTHKIVRGGSWADYNNDDIKGSYANLADKRLTTTTYRMPMRPNVRSYKIGFRCVRNDFKNP